MPEVFESAEFRVDGLVSAVSRADCPWTAGGARLATERVVLALAIGAADRVDRWQIEHVKTHAGDVWKAGLDVRKRAISAGLGRGGARKHLVPRAEYRLRWIDDQRQLSLVPSCTASIGVSRHQPGEVFAQSNLHCRCAVVGCVEAQR